MKDYGGLDRHETVLDRKVQEIGTGVQIQPFHRLMSVAVLDHPTSSKSPLSKLFNPSATRRWSSASNT